MSKEAVYGLSVCEDCNKSTEVIYKCFIDDSLPQAVWLKRNAVAPSSCPPRFNAERMQMWVPNVVYRCYKCAFDGTND